MPDEIGDVSGDTLPSDAGELGTVDSNASTELSDNGSQKLVVDATSTQEESQTQEAKPEAAEPESLKSVREWGKGLERDIKQKFAPAYTQLEKVATELYGTSSPEDILTAAQTVQALAPSLKVLTNPDATQADVVSTLQKMLPAEHLEGIAWATLNDPATQAVVFDDPEVLQAISDRLFNGRSVEDIQSLLEANPETAADPERDAWRKEQADFKAERLREKTQNETMAADTRKQELMTRFFETPAQRVIAEDFKLVAPEGASETDKALFADTAKDIRFSAQGRFLEENMDEYQRIQNLYAAGKGLQAQAAEIRLSNRYQATLIKTAERHAKLLNSRSEAAVNSQQDKINGVRPDTTGSVAGNGKVEDKWDIDAPDFAQKFAASFHN